VAEMAVLGVFFEHLYTDVNGVGKRDIISPCSSSGTPLSSLPSAPSKSGPMTPRATEIIAESVTFCDIV
jgi:hypothetical protein